MRAVFVIEASSGVSYGRREVGTFGNLLFGCKSRKSKARPRACLRLGNNGASSGCGTAMSFEQC